MRVVSVNLTDEERGLIALALRVAAGDFARDAEEYRKRSERSHNREVGAAGAVFEAKAQQMRKLALQLEGESGDD